MNNMHFCTSFDSNYLDKGLALYESLCNVCNDFVLYIFTFDDKAYEILSSMELVHAKIISLGEFETEELIRIKQERSKGEYCWTCKPIIVKYVIDCYNVDCCTYVDADLYFFHSPQILMDEFRNSGKSVGLVAHRFPDTVNGKKAEKRSGKYCSQFNTFKNDEKGIRLLELWKKQCLKECSIKSSGDQLYITDWGERYDEVYDYQHLGAGVAPWNLMNYHVIDKDGKLYIQKKREECEIVFYHFQGLQYSADNRVKINVIAVQDGGLISKSDVNKIYFPYLKHIERIRDRLSESYMLKNYVDGCGREFKIVKFNLKMFLKSFIRRLRTESLWSAIDLVIRVVRKRQDIIYLNNIKE